MPLAYAFNIRGGIMKSKVQMGARIFLGLIYFVFGLNGFLNFIPVPPLPENAMQFMSALMATGYFFPLFKATEVVGGAILLSGVAVPFGLVLLAPITVQIFAFHLFMTPGIENNIMSIVMVALHVTAASAYWHRFAPLFKK